MKHWSLFCGAVLLLTACTPTLTQEKFNSVKNGMSLSDVKDTVDTDYWNDRCLEDTDADPDLVKDGEVRYVCTGDGIRSYTVSFTFKNGRLIRKFSNGRLNYSEYN